MDIANLIGPYRTEMEIVVESTFNWYWLVDGLQSLGFSVCLAHTLGLYMITGSKVKTDKRDAYALAKLLKAGVIPRAYIYPKDIRPFRDLLRRRSSLVRMRASEYAAIRLTLMRHGVLQHTRHSVKMMEDSDMDTLLDHPQAVLHGTQELERIHLYSRQIEEMEQHLETELISVPAYKLLRGVPGIDRILAMTIYYETGDICRFKSDRCFSSYCRVVPGIAQSGNISRRGKNSKQGNPYLKWAFSQAAVHAVRCYKPVSEYFSRQLARRQGRAKKMVVYNIIAHKLAVAVYHMLRKGVEYRQDLLFGRDPCA